jgi:hypothetical protein
MYLSAAKSGSAKLSPNDGTLASSVPTGRASYQDFYVYNPLAGISVPVGRDGPDGFLPYAPLDQALDEPLGLTFTTPVLKDPLRLAGPTELRFWAETEASDMAWVGRLIDVAPNGSASLITQGWLRASFRHVDESRSRPGAPYLTDDRDTPVVIGQDTLYRMDIWDTAYTLAPGHRLRLWLSSSDFPSHEPLLVAGRNLIFHDSDHPSQLLLGTRDAVAPCADDPQDCPPLPPIKPRMSALKVAPKRFRAGSKVARVSYKLSEAAGVTFRVEHLVKGRKGHRTYRVMRGSFAHKSKAGKNSLRFHARLRGHKLAPGVYRLVAVAKNAEKTKSKAYRSRAFRVR